MAKEQAEADNLKRTSLYLSKALTVFDRAKGLTRQYGFSACIGKPYRKEGLAQVLSTIAAPGDDHVRKPGKTKKAGPVTPRPP
jgi:hypothetical protein